MKGAPFPGVERLATRDGVVGDALTIRRALPHPKHRTIGAWCFLDHAGPMVIRDGRGMRVGPHPHIGLSTFTWHIEGETLHRDSLGNAQVIRPGQVNLMTAGRGIAHSEESVVGGSPNVHLAQLWIALPEAARHGAPEFRHYPALPVADAGGYRVTVLVGTMLGQRSPVAVHTPLVGVDLFADGDADTTLPLDPLFEHGAMALEGEFEFDDGPLAPGSLVYMPPGHAALRVRSRGRARLLVIGGEPFPEEILLWWNFVARTQAELEQATADWNAASERFGTVQGFDGPRLAAPALAGLHLR